MPQTWIARLKRGLTHLEEPWRSAGIGAVLSLAFADLPAVVGVAVLIVLRRYNDVVLAAEALVMLVLAGAISGATLYWTRRVKIRRLPPSYPSGILAVYAFLLSWVPFIVHIANTETETALIIRRLAHNPAVLVAVSAATVVGGAIAGRALARLMLEPADR